MSKRWLIWLPLFGIAAWLAASGPSEEEPASDEPAEMAAAPASRPTDTSNPNERRTQQQTQLERLLPRSELFPDRQSKRRRDLFASISWLPPVAPVAAAPEEQAPPPPAFSYVGKQYDGKDWEVFLSLADQTYIAKAGAVLANNYKVEHIDASAVTVVDLRTAQSQIISIGEAP